MSKQQKSDLRAASAGKQAGAEEKKAQAPKKGSKASRKANKTGAPPADKKQPLSEDDAAAASAPPPAAEQLGQLNDQLVRLQADFTNYRRRVARERSDLYRLAAADVMEDILPVLDHLDLAHKAAKEHNAGDAFLESLAMIGTQLTTALKKHGLEPIDAEGQAFDAAVHEALSYLPNPEVPEGAVMTQTRRGYRIGEKLLRAAQVVVSSGPPPGTEASEAVVEPVADDATSGE